MYTTNEAAARLHIAPRTVTRYIERGLIAAVKHGRDHFIEEAELARFEAQRKQPGRPRQT